MGVQVPEVRTIKPPAGSAINFGAEITHVDLENLSDSDFATIQDAVFKHLVVVFKNQSHLSPKAQFLLTQRFDPLATSYGHGKTLDAKRSILHPDLKTVPHQPQVQIIGNGHFDSYQGLENFTLKHPHHRTFHRDPIAEADDRENTRFYRWHIDAALYDLNAPIVTSLLAVQVPEPRLQTLRYDDGSNETLSVPLGTTAFVSGETMYEILSEKDKEFVRTSFVEYAPHPYVWMSRCKSLPDGLGLYSSNLELPLSELPPIDESKIKVLPMAWKNPRTGKLALQIHPSAIRAIVLGNGERIEDLQKVREIVHKLQRPGISKELVYAHDWQEGDVVVFHNRGLLHSVVGAFSDGEKRLFRQCNVAASEGVVGSDGRTY